MEIGNKKTTLKDNAALYNHESDGLTDKEKLKSLKGKKKWIQVMDYYLLKIVATIAVLAFVISLLYTVLGPKAENVFYAAICDYVMDYGKIDELQAEFEEYIELDPKKQETIFDNTFSFTTEAIASNQKFMVYLACGEISVVLMPQSIFEEKAVNGAFKPFSEILSTEAYLKYSDRFVMCGTCDDDGNIIENSEKAYGLCVDGTRYFQNENLPEPVVLAVCVSWENNEVCTDFIDFLFK
jgi:hypothetical protein